MFSPSTTLRASPNGTVAYGLINSAIWGTFGKIRVWQIPKKEKRKMVGGCIILSGSLLKKIVDIY